MLWAHQVKTIVILLGQIASKHAAEISKGVVNVWVNTPSGITVYNNNGVKEDILSVHTEGSQGPRQFYIKFSNVESAIIMIYLSSWVTLQSTCEH